MAKILVVDDSGFQRNAVVRELTKSGHTCVTACNGQEALDAIKANTDLNMAICDMLMPVMDGAQFLAELKKQAIKHPPVMMLTANIQEPVKQSLLALGAVEIMAKPFQADLLTAAVAKYSAVKAA
jgi:OmpR family response regulator RpaB